MQRGGLNVELSKDKAVLTFANKRQDVKKNREPANDGNVQNRKFM